MRDWKQSCGYWGTIEGRGQRFCCCVVKFVVVEEKEDWFCCFGLVLRVGGENEFSGVASHTRSCSQCLIIVGWKLDGLDLSFR